jgi:hypothetical protein
VGPEKKVVGAEKKVVGPQKKVVGPEKMPWVPSKIFPYIYLSPFGMRVFFLLRLSQIYIVLRRISSPRTKLLAASAYI